MSRRILAGAVALSLPIAALFGLVLHVHPDAHDADHHHAAQAVHAHFGGHARIHHEIPAGAPAFDESDAHERAVYLDGFVGEAIASMAIAAAIPVAIELPAPDVQAAQRPVHVIHGHDPPLDSRLSPRAPPSFLS